ncbi:hypothetical protein AAG570_000572 [Ranatra chinensis]|uniref:Uncharacterized protein n=1 Tax=Ranatra chinensis TaxID=642074 RepID=A0ABD0YXH6_9HEMI
MSEGLQDIQSQKDGKLHEPISIDSSFLFSKNMLLFYENKKQETTEIVKPKGQKALSRHRYRKRKYSRTSLSGSTVSPFNYFRKRTCKVANGADFAWKKPEVESQGFQDKAQFYGDRREIPTREGWRRQTRKETGRFFGAIPQNKFPLRDQLAAFFFSYFSFQPPSAFQPFAGPDNLTRSGARFFKPIRVDLERLDRQWIYFPQWRDIPYPSRPFDYGLRKIVAETIDDPNSPYGERYARGRLIYRGGGLPKDKKQETTEIDSKKRKLCGGNHSGFISRFNAGEIVHNGQRRRKNKTKVRWEKGAEESELKKADDFTGRFESTPLLAAEDMEDLNLVYYSIGGNSVLVVTKDEREMGIRYTLVGEGGRTGGGRRAASFRSADDRTARQPRPHAASCHNTTHHPLPITFVFLLTVHHTLFRLQNQLETIGLKFIPTGIHGHRVGFYGGEGQKKILGVGEAKRGRGTCAAGVPVAVGGTAGCLTQPTIAKVESPESVREIFRTTYPERADFAKGPEVPQTPFCLKSPGFRLLPNRPQNPFLDCLENQDLCDIDTRLAM